MKINSFSSKLFFFYIFFSFSFFFGQESKKNSQTNSKTESRVPPTLDPSIQPSDPNNPVILPENPINPGNPINPNNPIVTNQPFHDTKGSIDVSGTGQLQFTLPIALPPGVKSVAPQINLVYSGGSGNGIAGYGWSLSGITSISRTGRTIEKDGEIKGIQVDDTDYFSFNGQRLILKSGQYGKDGAEYVTEKYSNVKINSFGISQSYSKGPVYFKVTFEDGSQAWYGETENDPEYNRYNAKTSIEYNIVKWIDSKGNSIQYSYDYTTGQMQGGVSRISTIKWGGNETLNTPHFNDIIFNYKERTLKEISYSGGFKFVQDKILDYIQVNTNKQQFKRYQISHISEDGYLKVSAITEYNSQNQAANPVTFTYQSQEIPNEIDKIEQGVKNTHTKKYGDFDFDGITDFIEMETNGSLYFKSSVYIESQPIPISYNSSEFSLQNFRDAAIITFKKDNVVGTNAGLVIPVLKARSGSLDIVDYEFRVYNVNLQTRTLDFQHSKTLKYEDFKTFNEQPNNQLENQCHSYPSRLRRLTPYDYDGDGISELIIDFSYSRTCNNGPSNPWDPQPPMLQRSRTAVEGSTIEKAEDESNHDHLSHSEFKRPVLLKDNTEVPAEEIITARNAIENTNANSLRPPTSFELQTLHENSSVFFDLKQETPYEQSFYKFNHDYNAYSKPLESADFTGDGIDELYTVDGNYLRNFYNIKKTSSGSYHVTSVISSTNITGLINRMMIADFNGDGKADLAVPQANKSSNWKFYMANGKGFEAHDYNNFIYFSSEQETSNGGRHRNFFTEPYCNYGTITYCHYQAIDLDKDGKSEIVVSRMSINDHSWNSHSGHEQTSVNVSIYSSSRSTQIDTTLPLTLGLTRSLNRSFPGRVIFFNTLFINRTNQQIVLFGRPEDCPENNCDRNYVLHFNHKNLPTVTRLASITQGGLSTTIEYAELIPGTVYKESSAMSYPFMVLNRINQSFVISRLIQQGRIQDFRYRGLVTHLHGKGTLGFRQIARSSWYAPGYENTKIWSGAEADPLRDSIPIKEWSVKTNDESQIFPNDISLTNTQLLSVKITDYKTEYLVNGIKKTTITPAEKPIAVMATIPTKNTSKDFLKDVKAEDIIEYDEYYLPLKTTSKINDNFAISTTALEYYPPNLTGIDNNYYVGRPKSKTKLMQVYGDSKGAKEEYTYENNLLKTVKTWNRNNTGFVQESYNYDGFGNIVQKITGNSIDSQTQSTSAQYDAKGRFVIKKTDNLGLETHITYNDWGQILSQTDPLGNTLTNAYDNWGKVVSAQTSLGGTKTYVYEKLSLNGITRVTENLPDGGQTIAYTNILGQNYKTSVKAFGQGNFISKEVAYDILGRKISESEPYFEGQIVADWNTISYDDTVFPAKVTATSFAGKIMQTTVTGNVTSVKEINGYQRTTSKTVDALGNVVSSTDKGGTINFTYNAAGEQLTAQYEQNTVTNQYDAWGRRSSFHDPSNGTYQFEYTGFGQPKKTISPKGTKEYAYNALGQLITQTELSSDGGVATNKSISFTYDGKGRLTSKSGTVNGNAYSSNVSYDAHGRILSSSETSNGKTYSQHSIVYDALSRVVSYQKQLVSSGITTKASIQNVYSAWNGEMYQVKNANSGAVLWELQEANARGQVMSAKLGAAQVTNAYAANGFLSSVNHSSAVKPGILQISYDFDAIKNELKTRTTGGDFNILESFDYDDNNRLVNWTDPITGIKPSGGRNTYDAKGRITNNDEVGTISYGNSSKIYQPSSISMNSQGSSNYLNDLTQKISYNENNDPIFIDGMRGDVAFQYGLTAMRQRVTYGGNFAPTQEGRFTKFYSEDGSFEVVRNNVTGQEKHVIYIGGSPYESNIVYLKDYTEGGGSYKFLHKDYLGSILAVSDEAGNKLEQRHFDAWGNLTHLKIGNNTTITDKNQIRNYLSNGNLIVDRGYTSHEHFAEVGIIHMNGRLYDPLLRRFLNADENIQDPYNTQNYNKYGYVLNNPLMYNDPSGQFIFAALAAWLGSKLLAAVVIGGVVGLASYSVGVLVSGEKWNIGGALKSMFWGAVSGAVTFGIGSMFTPAAGTVLTASEKFVSGLAQGFMHGFSQGVLSVFQGGDFIQGFASGALGSWAASGWGSMMGTSGGSMIAFGALAGGIGAELTGGNFWQGAVTGGIVAGLNHAMHSMGDNDDEYMLTKDGKTVKVGTKGGDKTDYLYDEYYGPVRDDARTLLATADVQHSTVTTGSFSPGGYPIREGFGYRIHTQFGGHGLYDPSFDIMTNVPLSGGVTLTKFGLTRLSKSAYGLSVGLGGSKTMLKSSYLFSRTPLNVSMGFRLPTIMGVSTNNLGVFLGRNSALIGAGSATYGGYNFIHKQR